MVQQLYTKIKAILDFEEKNLDPQVKEAALCMLEDLKIVLDEDSCRVSLNRCHLSSQYDLAEKSIANINISWKPLLDFGIRLKHTLMHLLSKYLV